MPVNWTPLEKEIVKRLAHDGLSAKQISRYISEHGRTASRNAVLGLLSRMEITSKGRRGAPNRAATWRREVIACEKSRRIGVTKAAPVVEAPVKVTCEEVTLVPLLQLERHHCRWPIGDVGEPGFGFCGRTKADGSSYCKDHAVRAATKRQPA